MENDKRVDIEKSNTDADIENNKAIISGENTLTNAVEIISEDTIKSLIYVVRGKQVMLDSDLAMMYQVETKRLNENVKRNIKRFPESYCFQLTKEEYENLRSQIATTKGSEKRRYLPYVFTEQGIAMLSAVLRSDIAIQVSIRIMDTFVEMRKFLANNSLVLNRLNEIEIRQLGYQKEADEKFEKIFNYISDHEEDNQKIFFEGQIYDAFSLIVNLIQKAKKNIKLVDGYVDINTLNILSKKKNKVSVTVYTHPNTHLTNMDINNFNAQYYGVTLKYTTAFHDRFLILDDTVVYHIGASIKDAGKRCFGLTKIQDNDIKKELLSKLKGIK